MIITDKYLKALQATLQALDNKNTNLITETSVKDTLHQLYGCLRELHKQEVDALAEKWIKELEQAGMSHDDMIRVFKMAGEKYDFIVSNDPKVFYDPVK